MWEPSAVTSDNRDRLKSVGRTALRSAVREASIRQEMHRRNLLFFQHRDSFEESIFSLCKVFFFAGLPRLKARFFTANPERSARKTETVGSETWPHPKSNWPQRCDQNTSSRLRRWPTPRWAFDFRKSMFPFRRAAFVLRRKPFAFQRMTFEVQRQVFYFGLTTTMNRKAPTELARIQWGPGLT